MRTMPAATAGTKEDDAGGDRRDKKGKNRVNKNFVIEDGVLTRYYDDGGEAVIPDYVTEIGDSAFEDCSEFYSAHIPGSVQRIGDSAFYGCKNLRSITISNGVSEIGNRAFAGCSRLEDVYLPDSVEELGNEAFGYCESLTHISIPYSVMRMGNPFKGSLVDGGEGTIEWRDNNDEEDSVLKG